MTHTLDLFGTAAPASPEVLPMPDADVRFLAGLYRKPESGALLQRLLAELPWQQETIVLWGQERLQPRLSSWHGDAGSRYTYSGRVFHPQPWTPTLQTIKDKVEAVSGHRFNSVLANLYRNGEDSVGWHSDAEPELGAQPVIASVSLGETRTFRFRHRTRKDVAQVALDLTDGSLLLMAGTTQRCWQHAVPKDRSVLGARINLTFRTISVSS